VIGARTDAAPVDRHPPVPAMPVAVLFGGPSAEHDVSVISGEAIADALESASVSVSRVFVDLDGGWWWLPAGHRRGDRPASAYDDPQALGAVGPLTVGAALDRLAGADPEPIVFLAFHGPWGEDGTVQALLEAVGLASAAAWACPWPTGARCRCSAGRRTERPSSSRSRRSHRRPVTRG
jgi:hypothetical protein